MAVIENQHGNDVTEEGCHFSSSLPSPSPALVRVGYLFTLGLTEEVLQDIPGKQNLSQLVRCMAKF